MAAAVGSEKGKQSALHYSTSLHTNSPVCSHHTTRLNNVLVKIGIKPSYLSYLTDVLLFNRKGGKRYININILENVIPNKNSLNLKCSINEFIISLK